MRFPLIAISLVAFVTPSLSAQRSDCAPTQKPAALPAPSALVDSSGVLGQLAAAHRLRDSMRFTLIFPEGDSVALVHPLDRTDTVAAAVLAQSVWPEKPGQLWAVQVRISGGAAPALTLQRATYCPPVPSEGNQPFHMLIGVEREQRITTGGPPVSQQLAPPPAPPKLNTVYEIVVTESGAVRSLKLIRGSSVAQYDLEYGKYLTHLKFDPALLDGLPIEAVYHTDRKSPRL